MIKFKKKDLSGLHNIGDLLCTPDNYFDIQSTKDFTIVGGGVWNIEQMAKDSSASNTVVWAAGRSIRHPKQPNKITLPSFALAGFRDILDLTDKEQFLPCVSCLNDDLVEEPSGDKTLVFTNANEQVSCKIKKSEKRITLTNACSTKEFLEAWHQCDKVITNSYHGIYWGLLSGREVAPYGYSSKFINATAIFDIEFPHENLYSVDSRSNLPKLLSKKQAFVSSNNSKLEQFRELNINFAETLSRIGIICKKK